MANEYAVTFRIGSTYARTAAIWPEGAERCNEADGEIIPEGRALTVVFRSAAAAVTQLELALARAQEAFDLQVSDQDEDRPNPFPSAE